LIFVLRRIHPAGVDHGVDQALGPLLHQAILCIGSDTVTESSVILGLHDRVVLNNKVCEERAATGECALRFGVKVNAAELFR